MAFDVPNIIVMEQAFHGRTMATLSATGNRKVQAGFEPLWYQDLSGFPLMILDSAIKNIADTEIINVAAIFGRTYSGRRWGISIARKT